jgi:CubicO group peptidase (beta-lactamase class C family)
MSHRQVLRAVAVLSCIPGVGATAVGTQDDELVARLVSVAERSAEEFALPGLVIGVSVGSDALLARGWGNAAPGEPADEESAMRAGSLTQQLITIGILDLVDEGTLALEDDISKYLDPIEYQRPEITLRDLLQHSSGLPHSDEVLRAFDDIPSAEEVLAWLPAQALRAEPGTCLIHSGVNTLLLGLILERATEVTVREYIEQRIIARLDLKDTVYCYDGPPLRGLDVSVQETGSSLAIDNLSQAFFDAAALCTSVTDLLRLQRAIAEREIVSESGLATLRAEEFFPDGNRIHYFGGFSQLTLGDYDGLSFGGGMAGARVHSAWYPALDLSVTVLASSEDAPVDTIERRILRAFLGEPDPAALDEVLPPEVRELYVGGYYVGCSRYLVLEDDERLRLAPPTGPSFALLAQGAHAFVSAEDSDVRVVFQVEDERVLSFILFDHGIEWVAVRTE